MEYGTRTQPSIDLLAPWLFSVPYSLFPIPCSLRYNAHMLVRLHATNYRCLVNFEWQKSPS